MSVLLSTVLVVQLNVIVGGVVIDVGDLTRLPSGYGVIFVEFFPFEIDRTAVRTSNASDTSFFLQLRKTITCFSDMFSYLRRIFPARGSPGPSAYA